MSAQVPTNLMEVNKATLELYQAVRNDRRMALQVKEGANALGKSISTCKVHLEACKMAKIELDGEWKDFMVNT